MGKKRAKGKIGWAQQRIIDTYLKLDNPSQSDVARQLKIAPATVSEHLQKPDLREALSRAQARQADKARGIVATLTATVRKAASAVAGVLERDPCDHCGNQPITIQELAVISKTQTDALKVWLDLREQHGIGAIEPSDPKLARWERTKDRARVLRLARALTREYKERARPEPPEATRG